MHINLPRFGSHFYFNLTVSLSHSPSMTNSKAQLCEKSRTHRRTGVFMEPEKSPFRKPAQSTHKHTLNDQPLPSLRPLSLVNICCAPHNQKNRDKNLWNLTSRWTNTIPGKRTETYHTLFFTCCQKCYRVFVFFFFLQCISTLYLCIHMAMWHKVTPFRI